MIVSMTPKELTRLRVIQDLVEGRTKPKIAARVLDIKPRQLRVLRLRYRLLGAAGIVSRHRGKPSNRAYSARFREDVLTLVRSYYADFGPTFAAEKVLEVHGIGVSADTMRSWMISDGLWQDRKAQRSKIYQPRHRRPCVGELIQIDGSEHYWFEDRGPECTLLVFIDDASSKLMHLKFAQSESSFSYFAATKEYIYKHGKPVAFYSDKHSIFRVANKSAVGGTSMTQFGRALNELNIDIICANSPQAKGRVERANRTLQDRLVKELRLAGACCIEDGNKLLQELTDRHNAKFAKMPLSDHDAHRAILPDEDIEQIFVCREDRTVSASLTIQYDKMIFLLEQNEVTRGLVRKRVTVNDYPDGRIVITYNGLPLAYSIFDKVRHVNQAAVVDNKRLSAAFDHVRELQAQRPQYRSEKAPARTEQDHPLLSRGAPLSQKRRERRVSQSRVSVARRTERVLTSVDQKLGLSYEDQVCLEIGRRARAEEAKRHKDRRLRRQQSRGAHLAKLQNPKLMSN